MSETGNLLDLACGDDSPERNRRRSAGGKFLGVHFACCDVYTRVYPNREGTAYTGHCPRCAKQVRFTVGEGGTNARFFTAF
jgi:hypothetical protein